MITAKVLGLTVLKSGANGEELVLCPFHDDRTPSAWYNSNKGLLYCAVCGAGWNLVQLSEKLGFQLEDYDQEEMPRPYRLIDDALLFELGERIYHDYFKQRGISQMIIDYYHVRWFVGTPEAAVFPMVGLDGGIHGAVYRFLNTAQTGTRYKFLGNHTPVWPIKLLKTRHPQETLVVTEGAFSAMRIASVMSDVRPVALMGAKANQEIVDTLRCFDTVFLYDDDQAGHRAKDKMQHLWPSCVVHCVSPSPDDMSVVQVHRLMEKIL